MMASNVGGSVPNCLPEVTIIPALQNLRIPVIQASFFFWSIGIHYHDNLSRYCYHIYSPNFPLLIFKLCRALIQLLSTRNYAKTPLKLYATLTNRKESLLGARMFPFRKLP